MAPHRLSVPWDGQRCHQVEVLGLMPMSMLMPAFILWLLTAVTGWGLLVPVPVPVPYRPRSRRLVVVVAAAVSTGNTSRCWAFLRCRLPAVS